MLTASAMIMPTKPIYDRGRDRERIAYNEKTTDVNRIQLAHGTSQAQIQEKKNILPYNIASRNNGNDDSDGGYVMIMAGDDDDDDENNA